MLACSATVEITLSLVDAQPVGHALEDALVGLVRDEPVDVGDRDAGVGRGGGDRLGDIDHGVAEHLVALHPQVADRAGRRGAAVDIEQVLLGAVAAQGEAQQAAVGRWSPPLRPAPRTTAPAPSPNSTQVPRSVQSISRVMVSAPMTRAHLARPRATKPSATHRRVDEARADRLDVEGDADRRAQLALHDGGGGREGQVRRGGGDDDQVDVGGRAAGGVQGALGGLDRQVARRLVVAARVALLDAGALADPLVGGVDDLGQVVVGDDLVRADSRRRR